MLWIGNQDWLRRYGKRMTGWLKPAIIKRART